MTQNQMAELFQTTVANINIHIKNIFDEDKLVEAATIKNFLIVRLRVCIISEKPLAGLMRPLKTSCRMMKEYNNER